MAGGVRSSKDMATQVGINFEGRSKSKSAGVRAGVRQEKKKHPSRGYSCPNTYCLTVLNMFDESQILSGYTKK